MHFRPRYSLLTLLLLTAMVAGGIKYWRGPHWAELKEPPTQEEKAFFEQHPLLRNFIWDYGAEPVRYQFTRTGEGVTWHLIEGRDFSRPMLITMPPRELINGYPWTMPLKNGWQPIVYWIAGIGAKPEEDALYLLTEDKNIYRRLRTPEDSLVTVPLDQIENPLVRERLAEELEQLHVKQTAEKTTP